MVAAVTPTRLTLRPAFRKCEPRLCPIVSPSSTYCWSWVTVTDVSGSEVGHSGNRHARAVAIGAGQGGATSSELAAQLVARVRAPGLRPRSGDARRHAWSAVPRTLRSLKPPVLNASCSSRLSVDAIRPTTAPPIRELMHDLRRPFSFRARRGKEAKGQLSRVDLWKQPGAQRSVDGDGRGRLDIRGGFAACLLALGRRVVERAVLDERPPESQTAPIPSRVKACSQTSLPVWDSR